MSRRGRTGPSRIVLLDKPEGPTSFDLVRTIRTSSGYRKVGHGGTLDPFASGLLVLGLGPATRLMRYLSEGEKSYTGTIRFGSSTDTDDKSGKILQTAIPRFCALQLESALREFQGTIEQLPPMVSALKVAGKRAYALYRDAGTIPDLKPRKVVIHEINLLDFSRNTRACASVAEGEPTSAPWPAISVSAFPARRTFHSLRQGEGGGARAVAGSRPPSFSRERFRRRRRAWGLSAAAGGRGTGPVCAGRRATSSSSQWETANPAVVAEA